MRGGRGILVGLLGLVVVAGGGGLAWYWLLSAMPKIDAADGVQVARGQAVYAAQCARCHGVNLEGQPNWRVRQATGRLPAPPHDNTGHTAHHADSVLFGITKNGITDYAPAGYESDMPAFKGILSDDEIAAVLAFIKSRWPEEIRQRQSKQTE